MLSGMHQLHCLVGQEHFLLQHGLPTISSRQESSFTCPAKHFLYKAPKCQFTEILALNLWFGLVHGSKEVFWILQAACWLRFRLGSLYLPENQMLTSFGSS